MIFYIFISSRIIFCLNQKLVKSVPLLLFLLFRLCMIFILSVLLRLIDDVTDQLNVRQKPGLLTIVKLLTEYQRIL